MISCPFRNVLVRRLSSKSLVDDFNRDILAGGVVPVFKLARLYERKTAVQDVYGNFSYGHLFRAAEALRSKIVDKLGGKTENPITYLCDCDASHIVIQWAIWMSGNIAVPLSPQHPPSFLEHYIKDSDSILTITNEKYIPNFPSSCSDGPKLTVDPSELLLHKSSPSLGNIVQNLDNFPDATFYANNDALILYTSGTTSKPKGVPYTFKQIASQISSLHTAWKYRHDDILLHALPLHHVHGQINCVNATLASGATLRMLRLFDSKLVWTHLLGMNKGDKEKVTVFMGVPTMYVKLIEEYDKVLSKTNRQKDYIKNYLINHMRLMVSGSAPLPTPVFERWEDISGHRLLERYGMTEIGMALSNPYMPTKDRTPGFVGVTLPGVTVRIVAVDDPLNKGSLVKLETPPPKMEINLNNYGVISDSDEKVNNLFDKNSDVQKDDLECVITYENSQSKNKITGELQVHGNGIFEKYWKKPEQTKKEFTADGWFKTGDTAMLENDKIKILGRTSVDIIKSGGYKISALEVEIVLMNHNAIADVAVVGMPDITWGEKVVAIVETKPEQDLTLNSLKNWASEFLPKYQIPTELTVVEKIPRNAMGKINKKELRQFLLKNAKY